MLVVICGLCSCYVVTPISRYLRRLLGADGDDKRRVAVAPAENYEEADAKKEVRRKSSLKKVNTCLPLSWWHRYHPGLL